MSGEAKQEDVGKALVTVEDHGAAALKQQIEFLENALRFERIKNAILVDEATEYEGARADADLAPYAERMSNETRKHLREQLIVNRGATLALLSELDKTKPSEPTSVPKAAEVVVTKQPLHNRALSRPVAPADVGGGGGAAKGVSGDDARSAKIRNRAQELCAAEGIAFQSAFRRAERELGENG